MRHLAQQPHTKRTPTRTPTAHQPHGPDKPLAQDPISAFVSIQLPRLVRYSTVAPAAWKG